MVAAHDWGDPACWPAECPDGLGCEYEFATLPWSDAPRNRHRKRGLLPCAMAGVLFAAIQRRRHRAAA